MPQQYNIEECLALGTHLRVCDRDGFCGACGHQENPSKTVRGLSAELDELGISDLSIAQEDDTWRAYFKVKDGSETQRWCTDACSSLAEVLYAVAVGARRPLVGEPVPVLEVNAAMLFFEENINWRYCKEHASFIHKEGCEFMLYLGPGFDERLSEMKAYGCTLEFREACIEAKKVGALWVLFWA